MLGCSASSWFHGQELNPCLAFPMPWIGHLWRSDQLKCHVSWSDWLSESDMTQVQYTLQFKFYIANSKAYIEFWQFITISRKFLNDYYIAGNNIADPKSFLLILWDYSMHFNQMITRSTGSKWTCFNAGNLRCPLRILNWEIGCSYAHVTFTTLPFTDSLRLLFVIYRSVPTSHTFPLLLLCPHSRGQYQIVVVPLWPAPRWSDDWVRTW